MLNKVVLVEGVWGHKPSEGCECEIEITNCVGVEFSSETKVIIGDSDNELQNTLDVCLCKMNEGEVAIFSTTAQTSFTVRLIGFKFNGYLYEWDAGRKVHLAQSHKDKGVALFKQKLYKNAAFRFMKALKILHSIPINAEFRPEQIDGVPLDKIEKMKGVLYNNLASFYLHKEEWGLTVETCKKVLSYDLNNIKAHYKLGAAYIGEKNFERAHEEMAFVLEQEPTNTAALEHMKHIKTELAKAQNAFDSIIKKMFI